MPDGPAAQLGGAEDAEPVGRDRSIQHRAGRARPGRPADRTRRHVAEHLTLAATLPSYRRSLKRQGDSELEDVIVAGDARGVEATVQRYADAGAAELVLFSRGCRAIALVRRSDPAARLTRRRPRFHPELNRSRSPWSSWLHFNLFQ